MSDMSGIIPQPQLILPSIQAPHGKKFRSEAEGILYGMLFGISQFLSTSSSNLFLDQDKVIIEEIRALDTLYRSENFRKTLRILKHEEFIDFFQFIMNTAMSIGYIRPSLLSQKIEIVPDHFSQEKGAPIILLTFIRSRDKLTVTKINTENDQVEYKEYNASNNIVKDETPEKRRTVLKNRTWGRNYFPLPFPSGFWEIGKIEDGNEFEGNLSVFITTAHQTVDVYDEKYDETTGKIVWGEAGQEEDWGYNIHAGGGSKGWKSETEGCIRVEGTTIQVLKELFENKGTNDKMYLSVESKW